jgi:hypothetical protein
MLQSFKRNRSADKVIYRSFFHIKMRRLVLCIFTTLALHNVLYFAQNSPSQQNAPPPVLKKAVLCEKVVNSNKPVNEGVVFSSNLGRLICFTDFDPVYEETVIYHKFYFKDKLSSKFQLTLKPPRWAAQSSIQLRESDKGPWRVEITDAEDNILSTIRFSITD